MNQQRQSVIVMERDPQVLKGLSLLLEDMQFTVIPAQHYDAFDNIRDVQTARPVLLLLPLEFDPSHSGIELVTRLRTLFEHRIPAILFSHENGFNSDRFIDEDIVVLSDRMTPKDLRCTISTLLNNELVV